MSEQVKGRRSYDASGRQEQARLTRLGVVRAAYDLFVEKGYGRTTIGDVARAAGVSPETIYGAFGSKAGLLHRVWDVTIGGDDDDVVYHERPEILALQKEGDLARRLELQARLFTSTAQRVAPFLLAVQGAASSDEAAAQMLEEMGRQRLHGLSVMAAAAAATGQLAVSEEHCRDIMWATTDGVLWHRLVQQRGWSDDEFAHWLAGVWIASLVR
jgi:AcrR family transcriptional regulator